MFSREKLLAGLKCNFTKKLNCGMHKPMIREREFILYYRLSCPPMVMLLKMRRIKERY